MWTYHWDSDDRLTRISTPEGHRWIYLYDPLGRRVGKERRDTNGRVADRVEFVWDGDRPRHPVPEGASPRCCRAQHTAVRRSHQTDRASSPYRSSPSKVPMGTAFMFPGAGSSYADPVAHYPPGG
ncbi:RHS repeat domain-containing protein [Streptomyces sp. NPDC052036]|uniref:RHS repeat domain-containing protein n=1 Tax=Streptomyces sp. NPDC052036 TaxID=3155171 RepID=UPI003418959E